MILIELEAAIDDGGTLRSFYVGTDKFATQATDTPPNVAFSHRVKKPGSLSVNAWADGATGGRTKLSLGEIILLNGDKALDGWKNYGWDHRRVVIREGVAGASYPSNFETLMTAVVERVTFDREEVVFTIRDPQLIFESTILTERYDGSNSGSEGVEGTADDLKDQFKPLLLGTALNIAPPCVNTVKQTYQVNTGAAEIAAVYDQGVLLTKSTDHDTLADLTAATISGGTFQTCEAEGYFRIAAPTGTVTADASDGLEGERTPAHLLRRLAILAGVLESEIDGGAWLQLAAQAPFEAGVWIFDESNFASVMDSLAASVGAFYGFTRTGAFTMAQLRDPADNALGVTTITTSKYRDIVQRTPRDGGPVYAVNIRHARNYTPQEGGDLAGSVTTEDRAWLGREYRDAVEVRSWVKAKYLGAGVLTIDGCLVEYTDAKYEAERQADLHAVRRDVFELSGATSLLAVDLGDVVLLYGDRFGLEGGKSCRVIGRSIDYSRRQTNGGLILWG